MTFVAEDTIQALRGYAPEELLHYEGTLRAACSAVSPAFGQAWYGEKYRAVASDPSWLASSLIANAEKEAEGSRKLWTLTARTPDKETAEAIRRHAIDESRHALLYVAMCELVFPDALDGALKVYAHSLSPRYSSLDFPPGAEKSSQESVLDELIQMNIGEIRTRIHQLLMRPVLIAYCPQHQRDRLIRVLDSLLNDETKHVLYTARLIEKASCTGYANIVREITLERLREFNNITLAEVGEARFVGE
ncbi:Uncharacterised protein [Burkholderia pseudomallei]|uniref:hypothetical protein n=1 Tax=Burkholderia pseudomallei TaxID=28450 RepID=UPI000F21D056|nr:hypothetical protein [Burkholderia pseudomallei]VBM56243.1 Uncharacterised protein [Burkholderia pseudomallei]